MTVVHLDTNVLIGALRPGSPADRALRDRLDAGDTIGISAMAWAEFCCGADAGGVRPALRALARDLVGEPVPLDASAAELAAAWYNTHMGRKRGTLGDCLVAAVAHGQSATILTADTSHFGPLADAGVRVVGVS